MHRVVGRPRRKLGMHQPSQSLPAVPTPTAPQTTKPILILSGCRWHATGGGQRPVQLARALRDRGYEVIYVSHWERRSSVEEGITCWSLEHLTEQIPALLKLQSMVFCGFPAAYRYIIGLRGWLRVLDICDDWGEFVASGLLHEEHWTERMALVACLDAQAVTYSAQVLGQQAHSFGARNNIYLPNAGPAEPITCTSPPANFLWSTGPAAVFCGCLWGNWLDWDVVAATAKALARVDGTVNIIGGVDSAARSAPRPEAPNIRYHGNKPYAEAMQYVAASDVGLIPFKGEGICRSVDPVKYYDYIAAGLPVVATEVLTEIKGRPHVTLARPEDFPAAVLRAARRPRIAQTYRQQFCDEHSWPARAEAVLNIAKQPGVWD